MKIVNKVECYGELEEDSNFWVVCEDENDDMTWLDGNLETNKPFASWEEVVTVLQEYCESTIVEITIM